MDLYNNGILEPNISLDLIEFRLNYVAENNTQVYSGGSLSRRVQAGDVHYDPFSTQDDLRQEVPKTPRHITYTPDYVTFELPLCAVVDMTAAFDPKRNPISDIVTHFSGRGYLNGPEMIAINEGIFQLIRGDLVVEKKLLGIFVKGDDLIASYVGAAISQQLTTLIEMQRSDRNCG